MPVYIGKSGDLVGCYRCLTDTQTTEDRATQLLYSIQFKLSHAMITLKVCYLTRLVSKDAASDKLPIDHTYFQVERFTQNGICIIYQA